MSVAIDARQLMGAEVLSLEDHVRRAGVPVLPFSEVMAHKRDFAAASRTGIWRHFYLWVIPVSHAKFTDYVLVQAAGLMFLGVIVALCCGGYLGGMIGFKYGLYLTLPLPIIAGAILGLFFAFGLFFWDEVVASYGWAENYWNSGRYWQKTLVRFNDKSSSGTALPEYILNRTANLQRSLVGTGAEIHVESFGRDPLISVSLGSEVVYFGAWNTGTKLDLY